MLVDYGHIRSAAVKITLVIPSRYYTTGLFGLMVIFSITLVILSRCYTSHYFGLMVIFGPSVWSSGKKYSAARFLFIRPSGFDLMDPPRLIWSSPPSPPSNSNKKC